MLREQNIKALSFFADKQMLAEQIIEFEKKEGNYLPNQFAIKQIPTFEMGERKVKMGKIHDFYFLGIKKANTSWEYQAFEDVKKCKEFFIHLPHMEQKDLAFWFNNIEKLEMN